MAMNKRTRAASESLAFLAILAVTLVALNILGIFFFGRIDATKRRLFSLSEGSQRVVAQLDDELVVTAYFTKDLPPPFNATERYVRDLLDEYVAASKGKMKVRFINPDNEATQQAASTDGVQRVAHQKVENDAVQVVEGYRGLVFKYLGESKTIPAIAGTEGLEYEITQSVRELVGDEVEIAVLTGHEGASAQSGLTVLQKLLPTYKLADISATSPLPQRFKAVLIVSAATPFTDEELRNIDAYVMNGGSLGVFGGALKIASDHQAQGLAAHPVNSNLNRLLEKWGVSIGAGLIADAQCRQVPLQTQFGIRLPVPYPPMPILGLTDEQSAHPAAFRLQQAMTPFSSPLKLTGALKDDKAVKITTLAQSSKNSWLLTGDNINLKPREPREWQATLGESRGPFVAAVAIEGKLPSAFAAEALTSAEGQAPPGPKGPARAQKDVHVFVIGSTGMVLDDYLPEPEEIRVQQVGPEIALALNAIDWLSQEDALIAVRAKNVEEPNIEIPASVKAAESEARAAAEQGDSAATQAALEKHKAAIENWDQKRKIYRLLNIVVMPLLLIAFGLVRWQVRKKKRANLTL